MKKFVLLVPFVALALAGSAEVKIDGVVVRQQWPWSAKVKVEYRLSGVADPVDVKVRIFNGETEATGYRPYALVGDLYGQKGGLKSFEFEPAEVFGTARARVPDVRVELTAEPSASNAGEVIYRVYDFRTKARTDLTRADIRSGRYGAYETDYAKVGPGFATSLSDVLVWTGVTNGLTYKTDKIVFRKIPAKDQHFMFGQGDDSAYERKGVDTWFSHDYWIGVFELTQTQFNWIKDYAIDKGHLYAEYAPGNHYNADKSFCYSYETNALYSAARAQGCVTFNMIRDYNGSANWPVGKISDAYSQRWIGRMREYFAGVLGEDERFDLPTSAQWEFACRAGTTSDLYTGKVSNWNNLKEIGRFSGGINMPGSWPKDEPRMADLSVGLDEVGHYLPNAFGLYDMLGNAEEMCLDRYGSTFPGGKDPKGVDNAQESSRRTIRGCGILQMYTAAKCSTRYCSYYYMPQTDNNVRCYGVRIALQTHDF